MLPCITTHKQGAAPQQQPRRAGGDPIPLFTATAAHDGRREPKGLRGGDTHPGDVTDKLLASLALPTHACRTFLSQTRPTKKPL